MPTQHADIYNPIPPGYPICRSWQDMDHRQRRPGRLGEYRPGWVYSTFSGSKLANRGVIFDGSGFAVDLVGQKNVTVVNKASGTIVGGGVRCSCRQHRRRREHDRHQ